MHGHDLITEVKDPGPVRISKGLMGGFIVAIILGLLLVIDGFASDSVRAWQGLLLSYMFFLMLGLGGVVFTAIQYVASARWSVAVRRFAEGMAWFLPFGLLIFLVISIGGYGTLYDVESTLRESLGKGGVYHNNSSNDLITKGFFLSQPFVVVKGIVFYAIWGGMAFLILRNSLSSDKARKEGERLKQKNIKLSIAFLILFGYTFSIHCIDLLMALESKWFSTMFGVYCFSGLFLSTTCVIALITLAFRRVPTVRPAITHRQLYDLGTWIMAFSCFMCYIGFSQYMLIWYANIPEETFYMIARSQNGWGLVFVLLPLLKWIVPFAGLMPQPFRGNPTVIVIVCLLVLTGQFLDLYWMIYPVFNSSPVFPGTAAIGSFLALLGVFGICLNQAYSRNSVLPMGDPHLVMSVNGSYL